jgi:hypothetical protein
MPNYKMTVQKTIFGLLLTLFVSINVFAQGSLTKRNIICFTPTNANKINGIAIGLWNRPHSQIIQSFNGLNFEILGSGWMTPFLGLDDAGYTEHDMHKINGLSFGLTLLNGRMNGLTISPTINTTFYFNGVKIGLFNFDLNKSNGVQLGLVNVNNMNNGLIIGIYNKAIKTRGLQIGLVNKSEELLGIQIGLININRTRTLPFINWRTKRKY